MNRYTNRPIHFGLIFRQKVYMKKDLKMNRSAGRESLYREYHFAASDTNGGGYGSEISRRNPYPILIPLKIPHRV